MAKCSNDKKLVLGLSSPLISERETVKQWWIYHDIYLLYINYHVEQAKIFCWKLKSQY